MTTQLPPEIANAINAAAGDRLKVIDPATNREYVIVDAETFAKLEDYQAIRNGIRQMENGEGQPLKEAMSDIRAALNRRD